MGIMDIESITDREGLFFWIKEIVEKEAYDNYGLNENDPLVIDSIKYFYSSDQLSQNFRFDDLLACGVIENTNAKILDLASGFGQFVLAALQRGYDCWGVEPDENRLKFIKKKVELFGLPSHFYGRFKQGVGEKIPFPENTFDYITSFQTLEHVQDLSGVVQDMVRVVKSGGGIHIRCPDYSGTFEGHYRMAWLPWPLSKKPMEVVLKLLGRPTSGLTLQINYITKNDLVRAFTESAKQIGARIFIIDYSDLILEAGMRRRGIPVFYITLKLVKLAIFFRDIFRKESSINILVRVLKVNNSNE